jgi:hypothetical protein
VRTSCSPEVIRLVVMMYVRFPLSRAAKEFDNALIINPHGIVANEPAISEAANRVACFG